MKHIYTQICLGLLLATGSSLLLAANGFLQDTSGKVVTDGFGECVSVDKLKHAHGTEGEHTHCGQVPAKKEKAEAPAPAPKPVVLKDISLGAHALFDTNKSDLRAAGRTELDKLAQELSKIKRVDSISITGHTDSRGTEKYNQGLSERRANSVRDYLVGKGINASLVKTGGKGELEPVASNKTSEGRQANRRVDIVITGVQ